MSHDAMTLPEFCTYRKIYNNFLCLIFEGCVFFNFPALKCSVQQQWCWLPCSLKCISTPGSGHNASSPQLAFLAAQTAKAANGDQAKLGTPGRRPKPGGDALSPARAEPGTGTETTAAVSLWQESPKGCPGSTPALMGWKLLQGREGGGGYSFST